jgi:serine/threonine-protein kinase
MSRLKGLIVEIHRRSLWQVLGIYLVGAWIGYEIIQSLTEGLGLPQWFPALAIVLFIVGLPIVVATALVHESAEPEHLPPEAEIPRVGAELTVARGEAGSRQRLLTWRNAGLSFVAALAVWGIIATGWWALVGRAASQTAAPSTVDRIMLAVLPFENLGEPQDEYFADGVTEELTARLAVIQGLGVIARTSAIKYKNTEKGIREIGQELGVEYVLEGTVRWRRPGEGPSEVRVTPQLIRVSDATHVWANIYEEDLADIFEVQEDVAEQVAQALNVTLLEPERRALSAKPTENLEAYDYYLRGIELLERPGVRSDNYLNAQRMFERAVEIDPGFALAYTGLSKVNTDFYFYAVDRSDERRMRAREAAERALQIDPDLPEAHLSLGSYYYLVERDHDRALEELGLAERGLPGDVSLLWRRGLIWRSQGRWEEAVASLERGVELSPREATLFFRLGNTYFYLRRYEEAETYFDKALALQPDYVEVALLKTMVALWGRGDTGPLRTLVEGIPSGFDPSGLVSMLHWYVAYYDRDYAAALGVMKSSDRDNFQWQEFFVPKTLMVAMAYVQMGETGLARAAADTARRDLETRLLEEPDDPRVLQALSHVLTVLDNKQEAIRAALRAVELVPISKDAVDGPELLVSLADIYAYFGDVEAAVEQYELYLSVPAYRSLDFILLDSSLDPIRDDPRFKAFVRRHR